ncbi:MAG: GntR family transcriptional regulator [Microbacterium sp.]
MTEGARIAPIRFTPSRLAEGVYERLVALIRDGELAPGDPIRDLELADQFGVSRTPVREAIQRLERAGLIDIWPGRQTTVRRIADDDATSLHRYFAEVCALHVRLYLEYDRPSDQDAAELIRLLHGLVRAEDGDWATVFVQFMEQIRRAELPARGQLIADHLAMLSVILQRSLTRPPNRKQLAKDLLDAVERRDGVSASEAVKGLFVFGAHAPAAA